MGVFVLCEILADIPVPLVQLLQLGGVSQSPDV